MIKEEEIIRALQKAYECFRKADLKKYICMLEEIEKYYEEIPENCYLWGEYQLIRALKDIHEPELLISHYEKALLLTRGRSKVLCHMEPMMAEQYGIFCIYYKEGRGDEISQLLKKACSLYEQLTGVGAEVSIIYDCWLEYYRGNLDYAEEMIYRAYTLSMKHKNYMAVLNIAELLDGLARHTKNTALLKTMNEYVNSVCHNQDFGQEHRDISDFLMAVTNMSMGLLLNVPERIQTGDFGAVCLPDTYYGFEIVGKKVHPWAFYALAFAQIEYQCYNRKYIEALKTMALMENSFHVTDYPLFRAYYALFKMECYNAIGLEENIGKGLIDMLHVISSDGLWLIPSEFIISEQQKLLSTVIADYSKSALSRVLEYGLSYGDKLDILRSYLKDMNPDNTLTKRELEVALLASVRMSNTEISAELNIGINTVRYHIANIYDKLNINGRTELMKIMKKISPTTTAYWVNKKH